MRRLNTYKLLDIASIVIVVLVVFIIGMFLYIRFWPVDVINNKTWVLCTAPISYDVNGTPRCKTGTPHFQTGQIIPVYINSDKVKNVGGTFTTSAECKNQQGDFVSYPISEAHVNRAKGHVETEIDTKITNRVPLLPATCRIAYVLEYSVYSFRPFSEYNFTNEFILYPAQTPPSKKVSSVTRIITEPASTIPTNRAIPSPTPKTAPKSTPQPAPQPTKNCTIDVLFLHINCQEGS